jgi:DNA mismatch endonuclease (patch repair protein)
MPDVFTKAKRSAVMARIRGHGNKNTELALIRVFRSHRITGWRRHRPVFGKPDFVFPNLRLALFVDGCFWHACPRHATQPEGNAAFWRAKLARNQARDRLVTRTLRRAGWRVLRVWEHELTRKRELRLLKRLQRALDSSIRPFPRPRGEGGEKSPGRRASLRGKGKAPHLSLRSG